MHRCGSGMSSAYYYTFDLPVHRGSSWRLGEPESFLPDVFSSGRMVSASVACPLRWVWRGYDPGAASEV